MSMVAIARPAPLTMQPAAVAFDPGELTGPCGGGLVVGSCSAGVRQVHRTLFLLPSAQALLADSAVQRRPLM